eukprot:GGOE01028640.1.p1 GENE.GGOE01028640.1~~GGOE01028640.1.p1  ORF type:complete len:231 (+),score=10.53 GGOE01028640.1:35-694(+)
MQAEPWSLPDSNPLYSALLQPATVVHSPYTFQGYEEVPRQPDSTGLDPLPESSSASSKPLRECTTDASSSTAHPAHSLPPPLCASQGLDCGVLPLSRASLPAENVAEVEDAAAVPHRSNGPASDPFTNAAAHKQGCSVSWDESHAPARQQSFTSGMSRKPDVWRRYGSKVSPREALRQLQAFTFAQPVPLPQTPRAGVGLPAPLAASSSHDPPSSPFSN